MNELKRRHFVLHIPVSRSSSATQFGHLIIDAQHVHQGRAGLGEDQLRLLRPRPVAQEFHRRRYVLRDRAL